MDTKTPGAYVDSAGNDIDTGTETGVRAALADIGARLLAIETAPRPVGGSGDPDAVARLNAVIGPFFRDQLAEYDATHARVAPAGS